MEEQQIAPCGMNCSLCVSYQFMKDDLNEKGFNRRYCPGCIPRGKNCSHMGHKCKLLAKAEVRFCYECEEFPCNILKTLDKRYRTRYYMSMIENLKFIRDNGMEKFLKKEEAKWQCPRCGGIICCHNGLCLNCSIDILRSNKKYRWDKE